MKQAHLFESNLMNLENKGELLKSMKLIEAHERVVYSSIQDRKKIQWPNGARVALCIVPNVEHYEYLPPAHPIRERRIPMFFPTEPKIMAIARDCGAC